MSNTFNILRGGVGNTLIAIAYNDDGTVKDDLVFDEPGIAIFVQRIGQADGTPLTLSAKASPGAGHSDGAFLNLGGGAISVDVPDAPFANYNGVARIYGTFTGGYIDGYWYGVVGYDAASIGGDINGIADEVGRMPRDTDPIPRGPFILRIINGQEAECEYGVPLP